MKAKWLIAVTLLSGAAWAQTPAESCRSIGYSDAIVQCMGIIANHEVQATAAQTCRSIGYSDSIVSCMRVIVDKTYTADELAACRGIGYSDDIVKCMGVSGRRIEKDEPRRGRKQRRDDDDEDDDEEEDTRVVRVTNYHSAPVSKVFFRVSSKDRYKDARFNGRIEQNQHWDFTAPNRKLQVCIQTPDGFRLVWDNVKRDSSGVDIPEDWSDWAKGRCKDL